MLGFFLIIIPQTLLARCGFDVLTELNRVSGISENWPREPLPRWIATAWLGGQEARRRVWRLRSFFFCFFGVGPGVPSGPEGLKTI